MKILSLVVVSVLLALVAQQAQAKTCSGDPVAISYKRLMGGTQRGTFSFSLPNGCKITCKAGDTKRGINRVCHWN